MRFLQFTRLAPPTAILLLAVAVTGVARADGTPTPTPAAEPARAETLFQEGKKLTGLVEADATYFRESQKGSRKLIARGTTSLVRKARSRGGKPKSLSRLGKSASRKDLVPVLVGRLRGQPHVADKVLQAMNKSQAVDALKS